LVSSVFDKLLFSKTNQQLSSREVSLFERRTTGRLLWLICLEDRSRRTDQSENRDNVHVEISATRRVVSEQNAACWSSFVAIRFSKITTFQTSTPRRPGVLPSRSRKGSWRHDPRSPVGSENMGWIRRRLKCYCSVKMTAAYWSTARVQTVRPVAIPLNIRRYTK